MEAVRSNLGGFRVKMCGIVQYVNLFGVAVGYTIASAISTMAIRRSNCFHDSGGKDPCKMNGNPYMIGFGVAEIILSQIPEFDQLWWLSYVAAVMSFTYSGIGLGLGIGKTAGNGEIKGSLTGVKIGEISKVRKIWRTFQALGNIAFAYSYSLILIEIQDTVKSPPSELSIMKKASRVSIAVTTFFYMLCGCMGYAAFGDSAPGNLLTGFGFYNPFWLIDIANAAIVIHLLGAYQVFCQPLFAFLEAKVIKAFPNTTFFTHEFEISIPFYNKPYKLSLFRLVWRTVFVMVTTTIAMLLPFFNDVVGLLGAIGFWPLTVFFPIEMYIEQMKIQKWGVKWVSLKLLSCGCLIVTIAATVGSIAGIVDDLQTYKPFKSDY
ncbi:hypothetical protein CRG98_037138 [Punica granatum]|uniref:Amino acid transporter transmembrane domain-containing protein n=1 Tax=Punica granatum TaxID=22663 RepID=A0A2I0IEM4_PUNGR|nr:hypothetical protein CRG98_037138 [Punica granatum]